MHCAGPAERGELQQISTRSQRARRRLHSSPRRCSAPDRTTPGSAPRDATSTPAPIPSPVQWAQPHRLPLMPDPMAPGCSTACPSSYRAPGQRDRMKAHPDPTVLFHGARDCDRDSGDMPVPPLTATHGGCWIAQAVTRELPGWINPLIRQSRALQPPSSSEGHSEAPGRTQLPWPTGAGHEPQNYR